MSRAYAQGVESIISTYTFNQAPEGTKAFIIKLGRLEGDLGFFLRGGNLQTKSQRDKSKFLEHSATRLQMYTVLIDHPIEGLILWEVGPGKPGWEEKWGPEVLDVFCRVDPDERDALDIAISKVGYDIKDVKHVIIGHLHIDHAGGLEYFRGRSDVQVWVHETELKYAFWSIATKRDTAYLKYYLDLDLKWNTFNEDTVDIFKGLTIHFAPGHTPGLSILQLNLKNKGTFIFTTDHAIIKENYEDGGVIQGWLLRSHEQWHTSNEKIKRLQRNTDATVVFGHDVSTVQKLLEQHEYLD